MNSRILSKFHGVCPLCGSPLPPRLRDPVQCLQCGALLEANRKNSLLATILILFIVFVTYPISLWLTVSCALPVIIAATFMVGYSVKD